MDFEGARFAAKSLPVQVFGEEADWTELEASFARGCGDATILIANRKISGKPVTPDYLAALLDLGEQQAAGERDRATYWTGFCVLVRVMQQRLDRAMPP